MSDATYGGTTSGMGTSREVVSAVFKDSGDAQRAVDWLRDNGVAESAISVVSRRGDDFDATGDMADEMDDDAADAGKGALTGAGVGAGVGALFGLAAAAIPGIGPFISAGALANALGAAGGGAAAGAIVGGTSGALAGALSNWGLNEAESGYYAGEVERGGTWVGVDLSQTSADRSTVMDAFRRYNGRFSA
jgi:hypothetical protein